jgi:hypothetical protein
VPSTFLINMNIVLCPSIVLCITVDF